jgi:hypothetical protein
MTVSQLLDGIAGAALVNAHEGEWGEDRSWLSVDDEKTASGPLSEKYVSFSSWVDVVEIGRVDDYSPEEIEELWLSKKDHERIRMEARQSVNFMVRYGIIDDDLEFCARGLEAEEDKEQRRRNHKEAIDSVLNEQYLQRAEGSNVPELIAMLYSVLSFPCQQQAHILAIRDALDVDETHYGGHCEIHFESEIPFAGESVLQLLAEEDKISIEETFSSIEEWLVERFEKAERLVNVGRVRQFTTTDSR